MNSKYLYSVVYYEYLLICVAVLMYAVFMCHKYNTMFGLLSILISICALKMAYIIDIKSNQLEHTKMLKEILKKLKNE